MITHRHRHLILLSLLLVGASLVYFLLPNASGQVGGVAEFDGYYYYVYLRSLQMDGDIHFANEYAQWGNPFKFGLTQTGYARNIFGVGPALLWAPFFLLAHLLAIIGLKLGFPLSLDGLSRFHQVITFYGTLLYGWMAVVLCYHIARKLFGEAHAFWPTLGAALAGPLPYYCLSWASYSHAQAALATSLHILLWLHWRNSWTHRRWFLFGLTAGLILLVRPACFPFLLLPLYEGVRYLWPSAPPGARNLRRALGPALGALGVILVFSPQLLVWKIMLGHWLAFPQGEGFMLWWQSDWASTLFSPRNGLLTSAPLLLLALIGFFLWVKKQPRDGLPLLLVLLFLIYVNGAVYDWWGWGFSARRFTSALPLFTIGIAAALRGTRERLLRNPQRTVAWGTALLVLAAILFNLQWMLSFSRRHLEWYSVRSTQGLYMTVTHGLMDKVFSTVGNPLSWPSSLAFTLGQGGSPQTYDRVSGSYLLGEFHPGANPSADLYLHARMNLSELRFRPHLSPSFGFPQRRDNSWYIPLRQETGHIFLPLNRPGPLGLALTAQAIYPRTKVEIFFNGTSYGTYALAKDRWQTLAIKVAARDVKRSINRLDLSHRFAPPAPGSRCVGHTRVCSTVDIAAVSGGAKAGNFAEIWVDGQKIIENMRGINLAVIDPQKGTVLGQRGFDVHLYPALYTELYHYLRFFPRGSIVVLATRFSIRQRFAHGGAKALALLGARGEKALEQDVGYVALGTLGAEVGSALEVNALAEHARISIGRPPPPWREVARYLSLQLE